MGQSLVTHVINCDRVSFDCNKKQTSEQYLLLSGMYAPVRVYKDFAHDPPSSTQKMAQLELRDTSLALSLVFARLSLVDLVHVAQTCKAWRDASLKDMVALKHVDLSPFLSLRDASIALRLCQARGTMATSVNLGYVRLSQQVPLSAFVPLFSAGLRSLDVSAVTSKKWVDDEAVDLLTRRCGSLARLNLFGCWLVTDAALRSIGLRLATTLQFLNLGSCTAVTDEGLKQLVCPVLQELNLWRLEFVTDRGLSAIADKCPALSSLNVCDCKSVTSGSLSKFNASCRIYS